ncbi:HNH endonuclease [Bacillus sp. FJAT-22090]|uniref:HNH endonuclease n=1 Tax=Bacillus sp. FJAT-22090 TaxID=1581038 RepID=UPI0011A6934A|nr:HNH endonuclease [Bacillus sp. FJAT-22090]
MTTQPRNIKYTIEEVKAYIKENKMDMELLSDTYVSNGLPLNFKCDICEYSFNKTFNAIKSSGQSCPACGKNGIKITKDELAQHVKEFGYEIVDFLGGDSNKGTLFSVQCDRGHVYDTNYREFNREESRGGGSCKRCTKEGYSSTRKKTMKEFAQNVSEWGYTISGDPVKNIRDKRTFICSEGHERTTSYSELKKASGCPTCRGYINKHTEESISSSLAKVGIKYLTGFINTNEVFMYECECGNESVGRYHRLLSGERCPDCSSKRFWKYDEVVQYYKDRDCELLETEYIDSKSPMKYKCSCGETYSRTFNTFQYHPLCRNCTVSSIPKGKNHHGWNSELTEEERLNSRKYPEYKQWRNSVYERDSYTCQCCGDNNGHNLNAHHILNHSDYPELRLDIDNGITLCETCHVDFHMAYGFTYNSYEQLQEYIEDIINESKLKTA